MIIVTVLEKKIGLDTAQNITVEFIALENLEGAHSGGSRIFQKGGQQSRGGRHLLLGQIFPENCVKEN